MFKIKTKKNDKILLLFFDNFFAEKVCKYIQKCIIFALKLLNKFSHNEEKSRKTNN